MKPFTLLLKPRFFVIFALFFWGVSLSAEEPRWHYPEFQEPIVKWLKQIQPEDVAIEVVPIQLPTLTAGEARRYLAAAKGKHALLSIVAKQLSTPAEVFLWEGGIWREDLPLIQSALQEGSHQLESGQIWVPGHPNASNVLAWIYNLDEPWNPYYKNQAVANRAVIISLVDLLMQPEQAFYWGDERSTRPGQRTGTWGVHPGVMGFTLSFQAYSLLELKDAMDPAVVTAWSDGIKLIAGRFEDSGNTGPGNMLLSGAVAFYYAYLATGDPFFSELYELWEQRMVTGRLLSPAGVYYDGFGRAPDASYEGIALHRIAELYSVNPSETIRDILVKSYKLKRHFTLPEPGGEIISPSHFNDRSPSGFGRDQYAGREVMIASDVPGVAPYLRMVEEDTVDPEAVAKAMVHASTRLNAASPDPYAWGTGKGHSRRMHDWEAVLFLPYVLYRDDEAAIQEVLMNGPGYAMTDSERYTEDFAGEFYAFRRPAYAALFYTGVANASDAGATNSRGMVKNEGGYFNGFGGGGLSAFWVPNVGTHLIGRMSATEGYERVTKYSRFVPGWMDWGNNHIIGKTVAGKILTSARSSQPDSRIVMNSDGSERLEIDSQFVTKLPTQGEILSEPAKYRRNYTFYDQLIEVDVGVRFSGATAFESLYETLPVYLAEDTEVYFFNHATEPIEATGDAVREVKYLVIQRSEGGTTVAFQHPVKIDLISEAFGSRQQGPLVTVRAYQVAFSKLRFEGGERGALFYNLIPFQGDWSFDSMPSSRGRSMADLFPEPGAVAEPVVLLVDGVLKAELLNADFDDVRPEPCAVGTAFDPLNPMQGVASSKTAANVARGGGRQLRGSRPATTMRGAASDSSIRTSSAHHIGQTATFEFFMLVQVDKENVGTALYGGGWAVGDPVDGVVGGGLDGASAKEFPSDRFMVGFEAYDNNGSRDYRLVYYGASDAGVPLTGAAGDVLSWTPLRRWYGMRFDLTYQGEDRWLIENLSVSDWGGFRGKGHDYQGEVARLASATISTSGASSLIGSHVEVAKTAYGLVQISKTNDTGAGYLDDIRITVPVKRVPRN